MPDAQMSPSVTEAHAELLREAGDPLQMPSEEVDLIIADLERRLSRKQLRSIIQSQGHTMAFWVGAVSAGKTFASLIAFLIELSKVRPGQRTMIIGRTLKTIEGNIMSELMDESKFGPIASTIIHTPGASTAIILGRVVELVGAPTKLAVGNIQGSSLRLAYVDEMTLIDAEFVRMLETRLRVGAESRLLATMNPASKNHYIRKEYILDPVVHDLIVFHLTMRDNPSLARSYIYRQIAAFAGLFFQRFILGLWTNAAGAIYDMWDPDIHVIRWEDMPTIERILCVAVDYGASHATSAIMLGLSAEYDDRGRWRPRLVMMDEWRYKADPEAGIGGMAPSQMAAEIAKWLRKDHTPRDEILRNPWVFVDPSAKGFREELRRQHVNNFEADNDHAGISDVASLLAQGRLVVTDRCTGWIDEAPEYSWDQKKSAEGIDEPVKERDDSMDAGRYAIRSTRKIWASVFRNTYDLAA